MYGHTYRLAVSIAEGAGEVRSSDVELLQVPELVPAEILEKSGARKARYPASCRLNSSALPVWNASAIAA